MTTTDARGVLTRGHRRDHPNPHRDRGPRRRLAAPRGRRPRGHRAGALRPRRPTSATCCGPWPRRPSRSSSRTSRRSTTPTRSTGCVGFSRAYIDFAVDQPRAVQDHVPVPARPRPRHADGRGAADGHLAFRVPLYRAHRGHGPGRSSSPWIPTWPASRCGPSPTAAPRSSPMGFTLDDASRESLIAAVIDTMIDGLRACSGPVPARRRGRAAGRRRRRPASADAGSPRAVPRHRWSR